MRLGELLVLPLNGFMGVTDVVMRLYSLVLDGARFKGSWLKMIGSNI